jgi:hypothetical protein
VKSARRKKHDCLLNDVVLIEIAELARAYPAVDRAGMDCAFCGGIAVYLACGTIDNKAFADYEPKSDWLEVFFELRSMYGTNFEIPLCETHMYGMPE